MSGQLSTFFGFIASGAAPVVGVAIWIYRLVKKKTRSELASAVYFVVGRFVSRSIQQRLNAKQYYRTTLDSKSSRFLLVPGGSQTSLETDESFISLTLEVGISGAKTYTHENISSAGSRLIVIGDPGSGKSSFVKRVLRDQCRAGFRKPRRERLPILINLKDLVPPGNIRSKSQTVDWALKEVSDRIKGLPGYHAENLFDVYAQTAGLLLLLDGLDEVATESYRKTVDAIKAISDKLEAMSPNSIAIVTMRRNFYQQTHVDLRESFPTVLQVRPFSASDIYDFVTRWPFEKTRATEQINNIYNELSDRPNLRDMCRNPLILAMYVANYDGVSPEDLPDTRTEFYSKVTSELLVTRRTRQSGSRTGQITLRRQREQVLGTLALDNLSSADQPSNQIRLAEAIRVTKSVLDLRDDQKAEAAFNEIVKATGVIEDEIEGETLKFIHLTFCEFLAALEVKSRDRNGYRDLLDAHKVFTNSSARQERGRLIEVVPFVCALLEQRPTRQDMLSRVENLEDWELFGRCLLETQAYDHPGWPRYEAAEGEMLQAVSHDGWNNGWLSRVHLYRTVLADATRCAELASSLVGPAKSFSNFFSSLIGDNRERVVELFAAFAAEDSSAAFRFAEESGIDLLTLKPGLVVDSCVGVPFLALAIERLRRGERAQEWAAILAESSLRYSVVAKRLRDESDADFAQVVTGIGQKGIPWLRPERRTLQISCIEKAISHRMHQPPNNDGAALLYLISLVRMPGRPLRIAPFVLMTSAAVSLAYGVVAATSYRSGELITLDKFGGFFASMVAGVILQLLGANMMTLSGRRNALVHTLLNRNPLTAVSNRRSGGDEASVLSRIVFFPSVVLLRRGYVVCAGLDALRSAAMRREAGVDVNSAVKGEVRGKSLTTTWGDASADHVVHFDFVSPSATVIRRESPDSHKKTAYNR